MKTTAKIIQIGNSQGVRLPKQALIESGLAEEVELEVRDHEVILRSPHQPREGWEQSLAKVTQDETLLLGDIPASVWDKTEWEW